MDSGFVATSDKGLFTFYREQAQPRSRRRVIKQSSLIDSIQQKQKKVRYRDHEIGRSNIYSSAQKKQVSGFETCRKAEKQAKRLAIQFQPKKIIPMPLDSPNYLMSLNLDEKPKQVKTKGQRYNFGAEKHRRTKTETSLLPVEQCELKVHTGESSSKGSEQMFSTKRDRQKLPRTKGPLKLKAVMGRCLQPGEQIVMQKSFEQPRGLARQTAYWQRVKPKIRKPITLNDISTEKHNLNQWLQDLDRSWERNKTDRVMRPTHKSIESQNNMSNKLKQTLGEAKKEKKRGKRFVNQVTQIQKSLRASVQ